MSFIWLIVAYLAGSCPTGYIAAKIKGGVDIRGFGSGNIGATNAGRLLGKKWGIAIALFDMLKGGIMVLLASHFTENHTTIALVGALAVIGHNYPVWLGFKGGKGVATTFGVVAFFDFFNPWPAALGGCVWFVVMKSTKYVSIASIAGLFSVALLAPVFGMPRPYYIASLALAVLSAWKHKDNLKRIKEGNEIKVGQ